MKTWILILLFSCISHLHSHAQNSPGNLQLKTSSGSLMQYYISLPADWNEGKKWPIVIIAEAAEKQFKENTNRFIKARGNMPFILVSPIIVTNGNSGRRDPAYYPYSTNTWNSIDSMSDCVFDMNGILHAVHDVQKEYQGEDHFFITGFEAGAHIVWAMIFRHPELLLAAAPVAGNYIGRCVDNSSFSNNPSRADLPIRSFVGSQDKPFGPGGPVYYQWQKAKQLATDHGYKNIAEIIVSGKDHTPMPQETLQYFFSLLNRK
jgi:predicted peptidase